jgi:hypothetical protein
MKPETCVDCGASPPPADTSYTVIGHGWRIQVRETPLGTVREWRCATCWKNARAAKPGEHRLNETKKGTAAPR